jgi:formate hydrogenlyase subunit 6/NADH:ubiquinone oxidoreductase subunit I
MVAKLRDIFGGVWSLIVGLGVSRKTGFEPAVTEQYPDAIFNRPFKRHGVPPRQVAERFRGMRAVRWDWDEEMTTCIACRSCERICPSRCISGIEYERTETQRRATALSVDLLQCCFCGLCVEVCPVEDKAMMDTPDYETVATEWQELVVDLDRLHERGRHYCPLADEAGAREAEAETEGGG